MTDHGDYQPMFYDNTTGETVPPVSGPSELPTYPSEADGVTKIAYIDGNGTLTKTAFNTDVPNADQLNLGDDTGTASSKICRVHSVNDAHIWVDGDTDASGSAISNVLLSMNNQQYISNFFVDHDGSTVISSGGLIGSEERNLSFRTGMPWEYNGVGQLPVVDDCGIEQLVLRGDLEIVQVNSRFQIRDGIVIDDISNDHALTSDSASTLCTQHSIKTYVDDVLGGTVTTFTLVFGGPIPNTITAVKRHQLGDKYMLHISQVLSFGNDTGDAVIASIGTIPIPYPTSDFCGGLVAMSDDRPLVGVFKVSTVGVVTIDVASSLDSAVFTGNISSNSVHRSGFYDFSICYYV